MLKLARPKVSVNLYTARVAVWNRSYGPSHLILYFQCGIYFLRPSTINKSVRVRTRKNKNKNNQLFLFVCNSGSLPEFSPSSCPHIYSCSFFTCVLCTFAYVCVYVYIHTIIYVIYYYNI